MKRTKKFIEVLIPVLKDEDIDLIAGAVREAYTYADHILVMTVGASAPDPGVSELVGRKWGATCGATSIPFQNPRFRATINNSIGVNAISRLGTQRAMEHVVYYSEVGWRISEPDSVRDAVEYHDGILTAMRYFQWDDENFRVDGHFMPMRIPIMGKYTRESHWDSPFQPAPSWMWNQRTRWQEAPFHIVDITQTIPEYRTKSPRTPTLTPSQKTLFG